MLLYLRRTSTYNKLVLFYIVVLLLSVKCVQNLNASSTAVKHFYFPYYIEELSHFKKDLIT